MSDLSRRALFCSAIKAAGALGALGAVGALSACTTTTTDGGTTYTVSVARVLSLLGSIESGLTQIVTSSNVVQAIGSSNTATVQAALTTVSKVTAQVAATATATVTLTVAKSWIATAESAVLAALTVLADFQPVLPQQVNTIVQAVSTLLPVLEALIGAVTASTASSGMTPAQAQAVIAQGIQAP